MGAKDCRTVRVPGSNNYRLVPKIMLCGKRHGLTVINSVSL